MLNNNTLLTAVLAASGGKQVMMYDDKGKPSVMVRIPKFNLQDIHPDLGTGPHPAFIVDGVEKNEIYIGAFQAVVDEGRACSLPGVLPTVKMNFSTAKKACVDKGPGWHMMTAWEWGAIVLWCMKNGHQPRGNSQYGRARDAQFETSVRTDGKNPGDSSGTPMTLTGTGPASWRHDNTPQGISDLVGNIWEWNDGLKMIDGRLYFPSDNNYGMEENDWPERPIFLDGSTGPVDGGSSTANGAVILNDRITKFTEEPSPAGGNDVRDKSYASNTWVDTALAATFDGLPLTVRQQLAQLLIAPKLTSAGNKIFADIKGVILSRNYGTRFPLRGGDYSSSTNAGLAILDMRYSRATAGNTFGFRPAFIL